MDDEKSYHMSPEAFRKNGYAVIDWIAEYMKHVESFPVMSQIQPGTIRASLPGDPPLIGEPFEAILGEIDSKIMPGITHWQSPHFFAYFPANNSGPSILGELLSAGLGVQGMLWSTSPACTELETHVLDWLVDMMDLPEDFKSIHRGGGVIQDSASSATICAILAARERATKYESNESGCSGRLIAYASSQAHSSVEKGIKIAGIGRKNLVSVDVDDEFAMAPSALEKAILRSKKEGHLPFFVCATVGTTSSNAMDPLQKIGPLCREHGIWMHVDAAMSGTAAICPEFRYVHDGLEYADSYCFNPHKWLFTNFDCDCFYTVDRTALIQALSILPEYLKNKESESGAVIDYRDWQIPLGRRFRALKLWFVIRHYGIQGLQHHIREHVALAQSFSRWVEEDTNFELLMMPPLNLVCFYHVKGNEFNEKLLETINRSGKLYLSHTKLNDRFVLRFCVGQTYTDMVHVKKAWICIQEIAKELS